MNPLTRRTAGFLQRTTVTAAAWLGVAAVAQAHPGHSPFESTPAHLLTSPYHLAILILAGSAMVLAGQFVQRSWPRRALQCGGAAALLLAVVLFRFGA